MREIEIQTAETWLKLGTIWLTDVGSENSYYADQFGNEFFCKNYPEPAAPVYSHVQLTPGALAPGAYEWHRTRAAAESVAYPGTKVVQTTRSPAIYRARIA